MSGKRGPLVCLAFVIWIPVAWAGVAKAVERLQSAGIFAIETVRAARKKAKMQSDTARRNIDMMTLKAPASVAALRDRATKALSACFAQVSEDDTWVDTDISVG